MPLLSVSFDLAQWRSLRARKRQATQRRFYFYHVHVMPVMAQKTCPMRGMIIVISDPNLVSNSRNLSICIEGNQNFTSGYLCHTGRPQRAAGLLCPSILMYLIFKTRADMTSCHRKEKVSTLLIASTKTVYSSFSFSHFCYFSAPGGWGHASAKVF